MAKGDFGKAFSKHRQAGGTLTRKEFGEEYRKNKITKPEQNSEVVEDVTQSREFVEGQEQGW